MSGPSTTTREPWWAKRWPRTKEQVLLAQLVWNHFKSTLALPSRRDILLVARRAGFDALPLLGSPDGNWGPKNSVYLELPSLLHLEEVRSLLGPVPQILRESCARFVATDGSRRVAIPFSEVAKLFGDRGELARAFLMQVQLPLSWSRVDSSDAWHVPTFRILKYENVSSLEEMFIAEERHRLKVTSPLNAAHVKLFKAVWQDVSTKFEWPLGVPFSIQHRDLGYVPELVDDFDLTTGFVSTGFNDQAFRICLQTYSVDALGDEVAQRILRVARAAAALWGEVDPTNVTLELLAKKAELRPEDVAPILLLVEWDGWLLSRTLEGPLSAWVVSLAERTQRLENTTTWTEYVGMVRPRAETFSELDHPVVNDFRPFISFRHHDQHAAEALRDAYLAVGAAPFLASDLRRGISPGQGWHARILEGLRNATGMVLLASRNSREEHWPTFEMGAATGRDIPPVALRMGITPAELPPPLQPIQSVDSAASDDDVHHALALAAGTESPLWRTPEEKEALSRALAAIRQPVHAVVPTVPAPQFKLTLDFESVNTTSDRHIYQLVATLENLSNRRVDDWEIEFDFPRRFSEGTADGAEVESSDPNRRRFRATGRRSGKELRPRGRQDLRVRYQVTTEIYRERAAWKDETASALALVDGELIAEVVKPMSDLEKF